MTPETKVVPTYPYSIVEMSVVVRQLGHNLSDMEIVVCSACYALVQKMSWTMHSSWHYNNDSRIAELQALAVSPINDGSSSDPA